jgi:hypothetical protein
MIIRLFHRANNFFLLLLSGMTGSAQNCNPYPATKDIRPPAGFRRLPQNSHSFSSWLEELNLKKSKTVFLFNGKPKRDQSAQFAVIDMPFGHENLQQCADAVMRLRAEWLYKEGRYAEIVFYDNARHAYRFRGPGDRLLFEAYLRKVFIACGTLSLENQLYPIKRIDDLKSGDVLIQGGSPGHVVIIVDYAVNLKGEKIFLLAQGFMPAQDIHILVNSNDRNLSPWYSLPDEKIETPEWSFTKAQYKTW